MRRIRIVTAAALAMFMLAGCASLGYGWQRNERTTSLVDFLYPRGEPPAQPSMPTLRLPLTVGVAFLPTRTGRDLLDGPRREAILQDIRGRFEKRAFVREIVPIPDYYLSGQKGFDGLSALARLYNLDLVALVSYDQVSRQQDNGLALTYLTIVGAYLVPGTSQEVSTIVDLAVVHPASRSLVLRAAGTDARGGVSTRNGASGRLHERGMLGIQAAAATMIDHFDKELLEFEDRVRKGTARVQIDRGSGGGGAFDVLALGLLAMLLLGRFAAGQLAGLRRGPR
jgi:rhombotail lipoprotein